MSYEMQNKDMKILYEHIATKLNAIDATGQKYSPDQIIKIMKDYHNLVPTSLHVQRSEDDPKDHYSDHDGNPFSIALRNPACG